LFKAANKRMPMLQLENLRVNDSNLEKKASRHVTIAISGFLSQNSQLKEGWNDLCEHLRETSVAAYAVKWEAKTKEDVWAAMGKAGAMIGGNIALNYATGGALTLLRTVLLGGKGGYIFHELFDSTKQMAKFSGELLACSLAIGYPFYTQSVSLLGFSLGCQVIKSALKTLHEFEANHVIQNVTFMGAAVDVLDKKKIEQRWVNVFS
jgi:hypothetical protein